MGGAILARRIIQASIVLLVMVSALFFVEYAARGPVVTIPAEYARFLGEMARGDLTGPECNYSPMFGFPYCPVPHERVIRGIGRTLQLVVPAFILGAGIAIPLGSAAAAPRGSSGTFATTAAAMFQSVPPLFFLGALYILVFGITVYATGRIDHFILPVATLMAFPLVRCTRLIRAQVPEALSEVDGRSARPRGSRGDGSWSHAGDAEHAAPDRHGDGRGRRDARRRRDRRRGGVLVARLRSARRRGGEAAGLLRPLRGGSRHRPAGAHQQSGGGRRALARRAVTADPDTGKQVAGWADDCSGTGTTCTLTMDADRTASVRFAGDECLSYTLTVNVSGGGAAIGAGTYRAGTAATVTATDTDGWAFVRWEKDISSTCRR